MKKTQPDWKTGPAGHLKLYIRDRSAYQAFRTARCLLKMLVAWHAWHRHDTAWDSCVQIRWYDWVWVVKNAHLRSELIFYIGESCRPTKLFEIWKVFLSTNDHRLQIESVLFSGLCSHGSNQPRVSGLITKSLHSCQSIVRLHIEWEFAIACWCWGAGVWEYRHKDNQHFWKHALRWH